jgi:hypothetical protein
MKVSLIHGMIGVAVVCGIGIAGCTCLANVSGASHDKAETAAKAWAFQMGFQVKGVSCANIDSDGDGYVSCSVSTVNKNNDIEIVPIECAAAYTLNSGCWVARVLQPMGGK